MKIYKIAQSNKVLVVLRGLPGSGKSTLAQKLGQGGIVLSTDDYFEQDGIYEFDPLKLPEAHKWNYIRALNAMKQGISPIVIDNNNVRAWEAKPYVQEGLRYGYRIEVREADAPWKFDVEELARKNKHQVPADAIQKKLDQWEPDISVEDIMKSEMPEDL